MMVWSGLVSVNVVWGSSYSSTTLLCPHPRLSYLVTPPRLDLLLHTGLSLTFGVRRAARLPPYQCHLPAAALTSAPVLTVLATGRRVPERGGVRRDGYLLQF